MLVGRSAWYAKMVYHKGASRTATISLKPWGETVIRVRRGLRNLPGSFRQSSGTLRHSDRPIPPEDSIRQVLPNTSGARRRRVHLSIPAHTTAAWSMKQTIEAFHFPRPPAT